MSQDIQSANKQQAEQGEDSQKLLLDQYTLYVKMADKISDRRAITNTFYLSLLAALLALLPLVIERNVLAPVQSVLISVVAILGFLLCIIWSVNILFYRHLSSGKFQVIQEMEQKLPYPCYTREWQILKERKAPMRLTRVEQFIPYLLAIPYLFLFIYTLHGLLTK